MGFPSPIFRLIQTIIVGLYQLILCNDIPILMLASPAFLLFFPSAGASHQHVPSGFGGQVGAAEVLLKAGADVKATYLVRSNVLAAMISMVHLCALSDILPIHRRVNSLSSAL